MAICPFFFWFCCGGGGRIERLALEGVAWEITQL